MARKAKFSSFLRNSGRNCRISISRDLKFTGLIIHCDIKIPPLEPRLGDWLPIPRSSLGKLENIILMEKMEKNGHRRAESDPNSIIRSSDLPELNSVSSGCSLLVDSPKNSPNSTIYLTLAPMDGVSTPIQVYKLEVCHGTVRNNSSLANDSFFFGSMSESDNHLPSPLRKLDKRPSEVPPSTSKNPKSPVEDFH